MSRSVYVSTNCFADRTPDGIRAAVRDGGWTHVEFSAIRASPAEAVALCRELRAAGTEVLLHNYFPPPVEPFVMNLASTNREILQRSRRHCEEAMRLSAELGAPWFAAHAGFTVDLPPSLLGHPEAQREFLTVTPPASTAEAWRIFAESVESLTGIGRRHGVEFLIENHVAGGELGARGARALLLGLEAGEFTALGREIGDDFGLLLDVGHLHCTARTLRFTEAEFLREVAPLIRAFHLSDNDGVRDDHQSFGADAWFLDALAAHPAAPATLEFERCSPAEIDASQRIAQNS